MARVNAGKVTIHQHDNASIRMNAKLLNLTATLAGALALCGPTSLHAQTQVFSENFDTDHSLDGTWVTNTIGGYNPVNLYFDYSTVGIPPAPHSTGGTTRGLKLQANLDVAVQAFPSGCSVSPLGFAIKPRTPAS